jgi:hypothetical protein
VHAHRFISGTSYASLFPNCEGLGRTVEEDFSVLLRELPSDLAIVLRRSSESRAAVTTLRPEFFSHFTRSCACTLQHRRTNCCVRYSSGLAGAGANDMIMIAVNCGRRRMAVGISHPPSSPLIRARAHALR